MIDEYIDDTALVSDEHLKKLYELSRNIKDKPITAETVNEMYNVLSEYGIVKNSIIQMNKFYENLYRTGYSGLVSENPFFIPEKEINAFADQQYNNMESNEEIVGNAIVLANRLAKIPGTILNNNKVESFGWSNEKLNVLEKVFQKYKKDYNKSIINFLDDIEINDKNEIVNYNEDKFESKEIAQKTYRKFCIWYDINVGSLIKNHKRFKTNRF